MSVNSLGLIQVSSLGAGYEALQVASKMDDLQIHEMIPLSGSSQVLLSGKMESLVRYRKLLRTADLERSTFVADPDPRILKAFYHLENHPIKSYLLVFETAFVGDLFEIMQKLFKMGLEVSDFRFPRFTGGKASVTMTGEHFADVEKKLESLVSKHIHLTFIEEPSLGLRKYFTLDPQA
jgi:hypothetical protein